MAKKGILRDTNNVEILPVTRGELVLDSSGKEALRSKEFLATDSWPGLMSSEDKEKLNTLTKIDVDSELKLDSENPAQNKIITAALENKADISDNLVLAEGMKNTDGVIFNLPNSSDEETQVLATQDDILRIVANSDKVYVGDDIAEDSQAVLWVDTDDEIGDEGTSGGEGGSGGVSEDGTLLLPIYVPELQENTPLTEEQIEANKLAYRAAREGADVSFYLSTYVLVPENSVRFYIDRVMCAYDIVLFWVDMRSLGVRDDKAEDRYTHAVNLYEDGRVEYIEDMYTLATKEYVDAHIGDGNGGGSTAVDTELSLTSNNPVSNAVITSNIGIRVIEVDINSTEGWQQVFDILISQSDNGAFIPVICMLEGQPAYVYGVAALSVDGRITSLAAICNGKTYVIPGETKATEYPFVFTDDSSKKTDNQLRAWLKNDVWNEAVLEVDGIRYLASGLTQETGYASFKVVVGNEIRTYFVYTANVGDIEAGTLTLQNTEYIGSGGSIDPEILEAYTPLVRDFNEDFNNDFTN